MKAEIGCAVDFVCSLVQSKVNGNELSSLRNHLTTAMEAKFQNHWHPQNATLGSAYRAIHTARSRQDPIIASASKDCNIPNLGTYLPTELTIWVDPNEVSYRIGDGGSICGLDIRDSRPASPETMVASPPRQLSQPFVVQHSPRRSSPPSTPSRVRSMRPPVGHMQFPMPIHYSVTPQVSYNHMRLMPEFMRAPYAQVDVYA